MRKLASRKHVFMDNPGDDMPPSHTLRDILLAAFADRQRAKRRAWRRAAAWAGWILFWIACAAAGATVAWILGG